MEILAIFIWALFMLGAIATFVWSAHEARQRAKEVQRLQVIISEIGTVVNLNADTQVKMADEMTTLMRDSEKLKMLVDIHHKILQLSKTKEIPEFPVYKPD